MNCTVVGSVISCPVSEQLIYLFVSTYTKQVRLKQQVTVRPDVILVKSFVVLLFVLCL